ncbi:MAG TPA: hypothetical protein VEW95_07455 [Candidatus Limnocylindrales bacterium]|nr:hypothetical protein [Candidatus Limnocylindrales bacterium]
MSAAHRLVLVLVAILVIAGIAILGLNVSGTGIGVTPEESGSTEPSPFETEPSAAASVDPSAEPSVPSDAEAQAILAQIQDEVIAIRGLEAADIGPAEIISRDELAVELRQIFDEEYPVEDRERDNIELRALGLLDPDQDVAELQLQLLGDQVLGFYDDVDKRMVVVSDAGLDVEARITYAHEYTHALQDAAFGLDSLETDAVGEDDRGLARTALIEGDATITMLAWMLQNLSQAEILEYFAGAELPDTTGIPSWMVAQLSFPYDAGLTWTTSLAGGDPTSPDFTEVDAAFDDPPDSTEQIIELDKWEAREAPATVEVPDLAAALGDGWEEVDSTPIGQATIGIMLEYFGIPVAEAREAGSGWGGDRLVVATGPDDAFAVAWRLAWDSPTDAAQFLAAYETVADGLDFPASVTELANGQILVAHASSVELLRQTIDAAD